MMTSILRRILHCLLVAMTMTACQGPTQQSGQPQEDTITAYPTYDLPERLSANRIRFTLSLREAIDTTHWPGFADRRVEGSFNYYHDDTSEVFFPDSTVLATIREYEMYSEDYLRTARTDSLPYHMELMISLDSAEIGKYYFYHPVQQFIRPEEIVRFIPSVYSTEWWSTMVIHEMFHHHQYNTPAFGKYAIEEIAALPIDPRDLQRLYQEDDAFKKGIRAENKLLLKAIDTNDAARTQFIREYLAARKARLQPYLEQYPDLEKLETYYMTQEGSARYVEHSAMRVMSHWANLPESPTPKGDSLFDGFKDFQSIDLNADDFSFLIYPSFNTYYYTLGFNSMRLLDSLEVAYKETLLEQPHKGLHEYLVEYLDTKSSSITH